MARVEKPAKKAKEPNRVKQMWDVFTMTRKYDNRVIPYLLLGFIPPIVAAYSQIEGQAGAVGAVLKNSVRRGWQTSEMPINVSPRTQDAVYRAVGRGGIALIGEGPKSRTQRMLEDERRSVARILPNVPVTFLYVGPDADSIPLYKLAGRLQRIKPALRKAEVLAVGNRLASLSKPPIGIPKGMDPNRMRAQRPR
jgi:hypothetical protein